MPALLTTYGLTALASAVQGTYAPPLYLVLENNGSTFAAGASAGVTAISSNAAVHLPGDTQLVLGVGLAGQETVTFTSVTTAAPYVYTLTAPVVYQHVTGDPLCRLPLATDTMAQVVNELQYDSVNDPNLRLQSVSGYSSGNGAWTMQFYLTGIEASSFLMTIGLSDSPTIGQGNLHYHATLGVNHVYVPANGGVDVEIDIPITLS